MFFQQYFNALFIFFYFSKSVFGSFDTDAAALRNQTGFDNEKVGGNHSKYPDKLETVIFQCISVPNLVATLC